MSLEAAVLRRLERLETRVWHVSSDLTGLRASLWRCALIILRGMITDHAFERAGYLTYISLLYLVPLIALMLAVAEMLGWGRSALEFVVQKLVVTAPELTETLYTTISELDFVAIGLVAFAAIVVAGFVALVQLESIVDDIWTAHERRPFWRTLAIYPLIIIAAPTVAALVLTVAAIAESRTMTVMVVLPQATRFGEFLYDRLYELTLVLKVMPILLICGLLTVIYWILPSGKVRWNSALVGGVIAGLLWYLAQTFYLNAQFATGAFRAVWGILAQIPLLLLWMYASWLIFLAGIELSFGWQHRHTYLPKAPVDQLSPLMRGHAVIEIARLLVQLKDVRPGGLTSDAISSRVRVPWSLVRRHLNSLASIGAVHTTGWRGEPSYFAAGDLGRWKVSELLERWRKNGEDLPEATRHETFWPDDATIAETLGAGS